MQTMSTQGISRGRVWVMASRLQTFPAAAAPAIVGTVAAVHADLFVPLPAFAMLVDVLLIQVGTNLTDDYYDAVWDADTEAREGFTRVIAGGLTPPSETKQAMYLTFVAVVLLGTYLVYVGGVPILVVGLFSVASGIAYTGGSHPLGYHGLGDLFIFAFFGLVAVAGTFYVQAASVLVAPLSVGAPAETVTLAVVLASLPIVAIPTNILVVNSARDREEDATTGKWTLAVRFGYGFVRAECVTMLALAYAVPAHFWTYAGFDWFVLLPVFSMPAAARTARIVVTETKDEKLNPMLEDTEKLLTFYAVLSSIGLALA